MQIKVKCNGGLHRIILNGDELEFPDHDVENEIALSVLAGKPTRGKCCQYYKAWNGLKKKGWKEWDVYAYSRLHKNLRPEINKICRRISEEKTFYKVGVVHAGMVAKGRITLQKYELRVFGKEYGPTAKIQGREGWERPLTISTTTGNSIPKYWNKFIEDVNQRKCSSLKEVYSIARCHKIRC